MTEGWGGATAVFPKPVPGRRSRHCPPAPGSAPGPPAPGRTGTRESTRQPLGAARCPCSPRPVTDTTLQTPPRWGPRHVPPDSLGGTICRAQTETVNYTTMQMFDSLESSDGWGGSPLHGAVLADKTGRRPFPESHWYLHESGWL